MTTASILSKTLCFVRKEQAAFQPLQSVMVTVLPRYQTPSHVFTAKHPGSGTHFNPEDV